MVARKPANVKGKKSKKVALRKKNTRKVTAKKRSNSGISRGKKAAKKASKKTVKKAAKKAAKKKKVASKSAAKKTAAKKLAAKKTAERKKKKRSATAKKGHVTRRRKARKKVYWDKQARDRQDAKHPQLKGVVPAYNREFKRIERELNKAYELVAEKEKLIGEQAAELRGFRREALEEARIRKLFTDHFKELVESDETVILMRLRLAAEHGELEQEIDTVAEEFDMSVSEVYDLYYSP